MSNLNTGVSKLGQAPQSYNAEYLNQSFGKLNRTIQQLNANNLNVWTGSGSPSVNIGNPGDLYLDIVGLVFYGPKTVNSWGSGIGKLTAL